MIVMKHPSTARLTSLGTHKEQTVPVIEHFAKVNKVAEVSSLQRHLLVTITHPLKIDSTRSIEEVHKDACRWVDQVLVRK